MTRARPVDERPRPEPLPDPSLDPLVPPDAARPVPPRLAAMKAMGSGVGTLGLEVGLSVVVGLLGGQYLDGQFGTAPWLTVLGFALGLAAAVRSVHRQMRRMRVEAAREEAEQGNPAPMWESRGEREQREAEAARDERPPSSRDAKAPTKGAPPAGRSEEP